jgi:glycosyltransferase involved in cell wall biosynthesis
MKILLVNWSWYATGGDWTYIENIYKLYESHGHKVIPFSTHNKKNVFSPFSKNFVKAYDFKELNKNKTINNGIKALRTSIVSSDALFKLERILQVHDIKVAHLHNIHHYITPAIIEKLHKKGIKIIWTLHDYKIICPENSFVSNGKVCEKCITGSFYHCTTNKCKKNSILASALASFEAYFYHKRKVYDLVDYYLCPSHFLLQKFVQFGFDKSKLLESNLCYDISIIDNIVKQYQSYSCENCTKEKYILYLGRLEEIKGVKTLIYAVKDTEILLKIVGSGNAQDDLKALVESEGIKNVQFLGFKNKSEVFELTYNSLFGVCPSVWYENFPFSVAETFLFSKPVIGSNIGGIPELVLDRKTGLLFEPGDTADLKEKILQLWNNEQLVVELGKNAREHAYQLYNFDTHWNKLNAVIQKLAIYLLPIQIILLTIN